MHKSIFFVGQYEIYGHISLWSEELSITIDFAYEQI